MLSLIYCIRWSSVQDTRTKRMCSSTSVIALFVSWETWLRFDPEPPLGNLVPSFQRPTSSAIKGWKSNHVSHVERHTWFRSKLSRDDLQHRKPNQLTSSLELIKGGTFRISIEWDTCRTPTQTLSICSCTECQPNFGIKSQDRKLLEQFFLNFNEIRTFSGLLKCKKTHNFALGEKLGETNLENGAPENDGNCWLQSLLFGSGRKYRLVNFIKHTPSNKWNTGRNTKWT